MAVRYAGRAGNAQVERELSPNLPLTVTPMQCRNMWGGGTLVNDQLDAQFFYFIIRLLKSSTCFEQRRAHHQEVRLY